MKREAIARARVCAEIALWRHGWAWPLAFTLLAGAIAIWLFWLEPARRERDRARAELAQEHAVVAGAISPKAAAPDARQKLEALQDMLRRSPDSAQLVRKMAVLAQAELIALAQSDYQQQAITTGVSRVQVTQPVRASYPQLRRYIESVLRDVPNASLDQVVAHRENVGLAQVEARLKWSLWIARPLGPAGDEPARVGNAALAAASASASGRDLFSARSWNPPPPPPAQEPAAPVAPPLPYAFLGKKLEAGSWEIYLNKGEQTVIVREGEIVDGAWRVDKIAPPSMALTYLPLGQVQTLPIGEIR
jgi:hypothetical protein